MPRKCKKNKHNYSLLTLYPLEMEAINFIKKHEPPEGYFLAFSGGKDSVVLYDLAKRAKVKFTAFYNNTLIDPPELTKFIRDYYPDVIHIYPKITFWRGLEKFGLPPHARRWCCKCLKEESNNEDSKKLKVKLVGIRAEESWKRAKRKRIVYLKNYIHIKPIFYWSSNEIWSYIYKYKLPYCSLYDVGFSRLGCIVCPLRGKHEQRLFKEKYHQYFKLVRQFTNKYYEKK